MDIISYEKAVEALEKAQQAYDLAVSANGLAQSASADSSEALTTANQTANDLTTHTNNTDNPHQVTPGQIDAMPIIAEYLGGNLDPNTTKYPFIVTTHTNKPDSGYWYIRTFFYDINGNHFQVANSYNTNAMWIRYNYTGSWSNWQLIS